MKIEVKSKKGLRTILSVIVDKKNIQLKMDEKLNELQKEVALKGFRPGKVPPAVIKSQFGKSIYGEVVDKILRDTSSKAIEEKKLKVAGQPKIEEIFPKTSMCRCSLSGCTGDFFWTIFLKKEKKTSKKR